MSASELALEGAELLLACRLSGCRLFLLLELLFQEGELTLCVEGEFTVLNPGKV